MVYVLIPTLMLIFIALAIALAQFMKKNGNPERMVKAFAWRVGLSIVLFLFILLGIGMGWWQPHGL